MKRTYLIFYLSFLLSIISKAQYSNNFIVNGVINGPEIKNGTASIIPISIGLDCMAYKFDSFTVAVVNNHFRFSGIMPYPHAFEEIIFRSSTVNFGTGSFFFGFR